MGNVLLRRGVDRRRIKIMKADGSAMKLRGPLCVKEILIDYPNHEMFEAPAGPPPRIPSLSRPLPERTELVGGHVYYLIPLPLESDEFMIYDSNRGPFAKAASRSVARASCRSQPPCYPGTATDSLKQQVEAHPVANKLNRGGLSVVSSSYSTDGSTVRLKLRLREDELASFLSANNLHMENVVVPAIIKRATGQSALSTWKPSLDTIPEVHNPFSDS